MSNKFFDILRLVGEIIIPAIATFYAAVGAIWGWPYIEGITGTLAAVTVLIGAIVNGLRKVYNKKEEQNNGEKEETDG